MEKITGSGIPSWGWNEQSTIVVPNEEKTEDMIDLSDKEGQESMVEYRNEAQKLVEKNSFTSMKDEETNDSVSNVTSADTGSMSSISLGFIENQGHPLLSFYTGNYLIQNFIMPSYDSNQISFGNIYNIIKPYEATSSLSDASLKINTLSEGNQVVSVSSNVSIESSENQLPLNSTLSGGGEINQMDILPPEQLQSLSDKIRGGHSLTLEEGTVALETLEEKIKQLKNQGSSESLIQIEELYSLHQQLEPMVTKVNNQMSHVTRRDINAIKSFFEPPLVDLYTLDNKTFILGDHSKLLSIAASFLLTQSHYKQVEVAKHQKSEFSKEIWDKIIRKNGDFSLVCDAIFLSKPKRNSFFNLSGYLPKFLGGNTGDESDSQKILLPLFDKLENQFKFWRYVGIAMLNSQELLEAVGLSPGMASKYDAIVLFLAPFVSTE